MKNSILCALAMVFAISLSAQNDQEETDSQQRLNSFTAEKRHEVSLDVVSALGFPAFNPRYEYVLGRYSGVGADLFVSFADMESDVDFHETFSFTPYYRQYFFSKEDYGAKGFYGEGFLKFYTYETGDYFFDFSSSVNNVESYFETAVGVGIGWKWVSDSGFLIDIGAGIGRNLGISSPEEDGFYNNEITGRGGVNFGWRF